MAISKKDKRAFGDRTIVVPAKTRELDEIEHGGWQDGSTPKTHKKTIEVQKELINVDHSGQFGEKFSKK